MRKSKIRNGQTTIDRPSQIQSARNWMKTQRKWNREQLRCIRNYLESLGSPRALSVWLLFSSGEHDQLVGLSICPEDYFFRDAQAFRVDYAATKLLSKCADLETSINTKEVALEQAAKAELQCESTNLLIRSIRDGSVRNRHNSTWCRAAQVISNILGPCPETLDAFESVGWSPGRTSSAFGDCISGVHKYTSRLDVTPSAFGVVRNHVNASPLWGQAALSADGPCSLLRSGFTFVEGNTMTVVPKNAKTDRTICYEPHGLIPVQLMVGAYLKARLARAGINLKDQSINQRRAQLASRVGHLATIDLSSASDTICVELVRELLPPDWFALLNKLRSPVTTWPDSTMRRNQKFSSMGNGFTFELESLLFYALCSAVTSGVSVYGDDIIIPTEAYDDVVDVLTHAGFTPNMAKSFSYGPFRESCGFDGFRGLDCTPVYIRSSRSDFDWFVSFHNALRRWIGVAPYREYAPFLKWIRTCSKAPLGPSGKGDGHYHANFDEACPTRARHGVEGWWFETYARSARVSRLYGDRIHGSFSGKYAIGALCVSIGPRPTRYTVDVTADRRLYVYSRVRVLSHQWEDIIWV